MYAKKLTYALALSLLCSFFSNSVAGENELKSLFTRITQHPVYKHALQLAVGIYSFGFLKNFIDDQNISAFKSNYYLTVGLSFLGAYALSKLAQENTGPATLGCATWGALKYFHVINPKF